MSFCPALIPSFYFKNNSPPLLTLCQGGGVGCEGVSKNVDEFQFLIHGGKGGGRNTVSWARYC